MTCLLSQNGTIVRKSQAKAESMVRLNLEYRTIDMPWYGYGTAMVRLWHDNPDLLAFMQVGQVSITADSCRNAGTPFTNLWAL